ncbi:hypothetical protein [Tetragenococcus koreensis]|uniref:hypothetical protein n=1 Tax=Tetragenococcus koreensis TaxID=290335 RepID=UPI000F4D5EEC|nr:hypothetical protein [Tetragenococcus koreensis]AYW44628.1 hypothetical protein C7K43_01070 [Tetragenococcus koreensis]GEN90661.1 hypothetical protein TKO01_07070 [Tetragenococcus koreensis]
MKKKQLAKLQQQFQPSFKSTQAKVFHMMEKKIDERYGFKIETFMQSERPDELIIRRLDLDQGAKDKEINIPLDENFTDVIKRIQNGEKSLGELFSDNLAQEVASFWPSTKGQPQTEKTTVKQGNTDATESSSEASESMKFIAFKKAIENYANFYIETDKSHYQIKEQTKTESRLLATISVQSENDYTIEPALNRKYKLKLELIPLIEAFAQTPLEDR